MSLTDHQPTDWGGGGASCLWCHESWPCRTTRIREEVIRETVNELLRKVGGNSPEPLCCDSHFMAWSARQDVAETMQAWAVDKLEEINTRRE